jgi:hypothetical protein
LPDRVGLTDGLSAALCRRNFLPVHDRGQVWVDVATMLAEGGEAIRHRHPGPASCSARWRPARLRIPSDRGVVRQHCKLLAITLRPGNAGSNHADDHIDVLARAIIQIPAGHRGRLLIRTEGAGAAHELLDWLTGLGQLRGRRVQYSVGSQRTTPR